MRRIIVNYVLTFNIIHCDYNFASLVGKIVIIKLCYRTFLSYWIALSSAQQC